MVRVVKGNLLDATEIVIAHQVNCQKKMNSGVAKAIREKYPIVFDIYQEIKPMLGFTHFIDIPSNTGCKYVANMYAQDAYGYDGKQYTDYGAFKRCCDDIVTRARAIATRCIWPPLISPGFLCS